MASIHYFPRYSQKENMVTNNTLLLFSRLYNNSPQKFKMFMNNMLEESGVELDTTVIFKQQEKSKGGSIPDGLIEQESFKVVIETKLYGQEQIEQIIGHLDKFEKEDKKIFLWINKNPIENTYFKKIIKEINKYNKIHDTSIGFASTTFKEIVTAFEDVLLEYDIEMNGLINDYRSFCEESNLIDNSEHRIRVVLTGQTISQNLLHNVYYNPSNRGYQNTKYLGLYKNKTIRAIGEIVTIYDAKFNEESNCVEIIDVIKGEVTDSIIELTKKVYIEARDDFGYSLDDDRRFFLVERYYECDYKKTSKGGLQGTRYIDLESLEGYKKEMSAKEISELLNGQFWNI